jgi:hydroxyethylthiazole kinase
MIDRILAESYVNIIRGNSGEIGLLSGTGGIVSGVDAVGLQPDSCSSGKALALASGKIVAVGGETDFVTDGNRSFEIMSGHGLLTEITGSGCMATSMIAAWAAVSDDLLLATVGGLAHYRIAAKLAAEHCSGPGTFIPALMDAVYSITPEDMAGGFPVREV